MDIHKILSTGSGGNCVMLFDSILVDIGVPFDLIKDVYKQVKLVFVSHAHSDHLNLPTLRKLCSLRPGIRIAVGEHLYELVKESGCKNIDVLSLNQWYNYDGMYVSLFRTYHDILSNGWRFCQGEHKVLFATDTFTLEGLTARNYSHYMLEMNYDEDTIWGIIKEKESRGGFAYERGVINSHLSKQQAMEFFMANRKPDSQLISLHEHK